MDRFRKISLVVIGILLLSFFVGLYFFTNTITGKVSFELDSEYHEGERLNGTLKISLEEGELIPADSKIIFENNGGRYEYNLSESISEEQTSGNFYINGESLEGNGSGYGLIGSMENQVVSFELSISSESKSNQGKGQGSNNGNSNSGNQSETNSSEEEESPEEDTNSTNEEPNETPEESVNEESEGNAEVQDEEVSEESENSESQEEEANEEPNLSPITGEAVLSVEEKISGEVYFGEEFVYELEEGQTVELVSGSVKAGSNDLRDNQIDLEINGNEVIVTTSYSNSSEGFGENYLGSSTKDIIIDLSNFDFETSPGELRVSLSYEGNEFISLTTQLEEGSITAESEIESNLTVLNQPVVLTDAERGAIFNEFGNESVRITRADRTNEGVITRFELGDFWVENHYSLDLSDEELRNQVAEDRIRFLKDLADRFSEDNGGFSEVSGLVGVYEV